MLDASSDSTISTDELSFQHLARLATRFFYDMEEVLVMEVLLNAPRREAEDGKMYPTLQLDKRVAERLKLGEKQVRRILARLQNDRLVRRERATQAAVKKAEASSRFEKVGMASDIQSASDVAMLFGIDYETLVNVVDFKLDAMRRALREERERNNAAQVYRCLNPTCGNELSALEVDPTMADPMTGNFKCNNWGCGHELEEVDNSAEMATIDARTAELKEGLRPLHEAVRECAELLRNGLPPRFKYPPKELPEDAAGGDAAAAAAKQQRTGGGAFGGGAGGSGLGASRCDRTMGDGASTGSAAQVQAVPWLMSAEERAAQAAQAASSEAGREGEARQAAAKKAEEEAWQKAFLAQYEAQQRQQRDAQLGVAATPSAQVAASAAVQLNGAQPQAGGMPSDAGPSQAEPMDVKEEEEDDDDDDEEEGEEETVYVQGQPKPLSEVTEDDQNVMTKEEFDRYHEAYQRAMG